MKLVKPIETSEVCFSGWLIGNCRNGVGDLHALHLLHVKKISLFVKVAVFSLSGEGVIRLFYLPCVHSGHYFSHRI